MGGSTKVQAPQPSAEERALQQEQVNLLRDQRETTQQMISQQNLLAPHLYKEMGLEPVMADGKIVGFNRLPEDPNEAAFKQLQSRTMESALERLNNPQEKEIEQLLRGRTLDALKGNLPVDPGLERGLTENRATLEETLRSEIGPGYATSTPGIQALAEFDKRSEELRYGARTGALTLGEQLSASRANVSSMTSQTPLPGMELSDRLRTSSLGSIMGINSLPGQGAEALGRVASGFSNPLSWYSNQRQMQFQAAQGNAASSSQSGSTTGALAGTALMAAAMF